MGIGNFKDTPGSAAPPMPEKVVIGGPTGPTPQKTLVNSLEESLGNDIAETAQVADKAKAYTDMLKEEEISILTAQAIADALLMGDYYEETYQLNKRVSVVFRTRGYHDVVRYHNAVERMNPRYMSERDEIMLRYFLASSISRIGEKTFAFPDPTKQAEEQAAFQERYDYILSRPAALIELLENKLRRFDNMCRVVMSEGIVENF